MSCMVNESFKLTPNSEKSPYALCFGIFGLHLIGKSKVLKKFKHTWVQEIINNLNLLKLKYLNTSELIFSKPYLQLLTFSLSALYILKSHQHESLKIISTSLQFDINILLNQGGVAEGKPGSNMAMFWAIIIIYCIKYLNLNMKDSLNKWVKFHKSHE